MLKPYEELVEPASPIEFFEVGQSSESSSNLGISINPSCLQYSLCSWSDGVLEVRCLSSLGSNGETF